MAQFTDCRATERESVGLSKSPKPFDRFRNILSNRRGRKLRRFFQ
jgi:hypothetical protein